jgi:hypothetical protein
VVNRADRITIPVHPTRIYVGAGQFHLDTQCGHMTKAWCLQHCQSLLGSLCGSEGGGNEKESRSATNERGGSECRVLNYGREGKRRSRIYTETQSRTIRSQLMSSEVSKCETG